MSPDAEEARRWLAEELAKAAYREATPTWFDTVVSGFFEWLGGLIGAGAGSPPALALLIGVLLFAGLLAAAYFIFGAPRVNRRSRAAAALFGEDDARDAATIRTAAERAAADGDWATAIEEMFRAIARDLTERAVLSTSPGTTAVGFAAGASARFPSHGTALEASAAAFDGVRYLGLPGDETGYRQVAALERSIRAERPMLDPVPR